MLLYTGIILYLIYRILKSCGLLTYIYNKIIEFSTSVLEDKIYDIVKRGILKQITRDNEIYKNHIYNKPSKFNS